MKQIIGGTAAAGALLALPSLAWAQETETIEEVCDPAQECCPPSQSQMLFMGIGTLMLGLVAFFLLPRVMERAAINKKRSPLTARHAGISLAILLTNLGLVGAIVAITGCFPIKMLIWVGVVGAIWAIHGIYALVAVKR
jgi:hypothetical protein